MTKGATRTTLGISPAFVNAAILNSDTVVTEHPMLTSSSHHPQIIRTRLNHAPFDRTINPDDSRVTGHQPPPLAEQKAKYRYGL